MARINLEVKIKQTESFIVLMSMMEDIEELFDLVPDWNPEKLKVSKKLAGKIRKFRELVEIGEL